MIFSRELLNKNIRYHDFCVVKGSKPLDFQYKSYDYFYLSSLVNAYKNLFLSKGAKSGNSVVIGTQSRIEQIALVLACSELGIAIAIADVDIVEDPRGPLPIGVKQLEPIQAKTTQELIKEPYRKMLPIDFFVVKNKECTAKFDVFKETCTNTIILDDENLDYTANNIIASTDKTVFLRCASGTKIIDHTHDFICALVQRNADMFYGKMCMLSNLNHGSSPAVYFLPGLIAVEVTDFYNFREVLMVPPKLFMFYLKQYSLDHFLVPYTAWIDEFFKTDDANIDTCILYTLGIIRKDWVDKFKNKVKDIISIFGTRESSGPTMLNKASDIDFTENRYTVYDNFYNLHLNKNSELQIAMPIYNTTIATNDIFIVNNNSYTFQGSKNNLYRINDSVVNLELYQTFIDKVMNAKLVIDNVKDNIYLAVYDASIDNSILNELNELMLKTSDGRHRVNKHDCSIDVSISDDQIKHYFRNRL